MDRFVVSVAQSNTVVSHSYGSLKQAADVATEYANQGKAVSYFDVDRDCLFYYDNLTKVWHSHQG